MPISFLFFLKKKKEVGERKKYIFEHANFNKEDKFAKIKRS